MMNCLSHLKDFLIYFHAIWPHEPSFSSGKLIDENENITRMSSYLKKFLTSFDQINWNERNKHLASFFHDLVAIMSCFYFRRQFEYFWMLFLARFKILVSRIDITLIMACDELRVGLAKMFYLLWINGFEDNVNAWISVATGRTNHTDQVSIGRFQARRNRHFVLLLLLCVPDERVGSYYNKFKNFIRICQNSSSLMLKHYVTFSRYFIDMSDDEFKFHIRHIRLYAVNLIGQKLAKNHDDKDIWYHFYRKYNNASKRRKRQIDNHKYNLRSLSKKRRKL